MAIAALSGWTSGQKHMVTASFLGWSLDAFDFFLLVFVLKDITAEFHTDISTVSYAIPLALALVAGSVAIIIAGLTAAGTEAKGVVFGKAEVAAT